MSIDTRQFVLHPEAFDVNIALVNNQRDIPTGLFSVRYRHGDMPGIESVDVNEDPDHPHVRHTNWFSSESQETLETLDIQESQETLDSMSIKELERLWNLGEPGSGEEIHSYD